MREWVCPWCCVCWGGGTAFVALWGELHALNAFNEKLWYVDSHACNVCARTCGRQCAVGHRLTSACMGICVRGIYGGMCEGHMCRPAASWSLPMACGGLVKRSKEWVLLTYVHTGNPDSASV